MDVITTIAEVSFFVALYAISTNFSTRLKSLENNTSKHDSRIGSIAAGLDNISEEHFNFRNSFKQKDISPAKPKAKGKRRAF